MQREPQYIERGNWLRLCVRLTGHWSEKLIGRTDERVYRVSSKGKQAGTVEGERGKKKKSGKRVELYEDEGGEREDAVDWLGSSGQYEPDSLILSLSLSLRSIFITHQRWASLKKSRCCCCCCYNLPRDDEFYYETSQGERETKMVERSRSLFVDWPGPAQKRLDQC